MLAGPALAVLIGLYFLPQSAWIGATAVLLGLIRAAFILRYLFPCYYCLLQDQLFIRCGLLRMEIPYRAIRKINPSNAPAASPALSLRRLEIESQQGKVLISPRNRKKFIQELTLRMHGRYELTSQETGGGSEVADQ
ncbi:PH domain-containing protein [Bowmanella dokdonensis]|uniref:PH domain-containing protein n=1 Tax=Bowmanella dokdonensis TaxID=751969 RepID=UPI0030BA0A6F